jgi:hypothetical protein
LIRHGLVVVISLICRIGHGGRGVISGSAARVSIVLSFTFIIRQVVKCYLRKTFDEYLGVSGIAYWYQQAVAMSDVRRPPFGYRAGQALSKNSIRQSRWSAASQKA